MNILEFNKKCADFLEWDFDEFSETYETPFLKIVDPNAFGDEQLSSNLRVNELEFYSDWVWIIYMVEAIEKLVLKKELEFSVTISNNICKISNTTDEIVCKRASTKKEAVVNAIDAFLTWHEESKE